MFTKQVSVTLLACRLVAAASLTSQYLNASIRTVDVAIVGGGSSGSHAAIYLKDAGVDVLVIEKLEQLGGMVNSFTNPATGKNIDFGVAAYTNFTGTEEYFARLGINITGANIVVDNASYVDLTTGKVVDYVVPSAVDAAAALARFANVSDEYADLYIPSYANWPAPDAIPEDLLLPFGEFAAKYDIGPAIFTIWASIGSGLADMLNCPTLYVFQTFPPATASAFLGKVPEYVPVSGRNQDIYDAVLDDLGDGVLLNSQVVQSVRLPNNLGVELAVKSLVDGSYTVVLAKRLLVAIEPTGENTAPFDLDDTETDVFTKGTYSVVHTGVVSHPSLPEGVQIYNSQLPHSAANSKCAFVRKGGTTAS